MGRNNIDIQVCGGWLDSFGYEVPAEEGAAWSRFINEHLMEGARAAGGLAPLATVPLQNGALAADVLREAIEAGFNGVMIGTQPKGSDGNLDDPDLDPFWQTASDLSATVYVHPMFGCGDPRLLDYDMINAVGRGLDTSTAIARLLYAGHFTKYAGMKVVLSHGGGALPYMLGRLSRNAEIHPGKYAHPAEGFGTLYFDTVLFDPAALRFLIETTGAEKVVLGSDYPFPIGDMEPCKIVHDAGLTEIDANAILGETAAKLFHLDGGCAC
jgi:aminocarboxymuconate-semialdehyde decarboxylase